MIVRKKTNVWTTPLLIYYGWRLTRLLLLTEVSQAGNSANSKQAESSQRFHFLSMSVTQQRSVTTEPGDRQNPNRAIGSQRGSSAASLVRWVYLFPGASALPGTASASAGPCCPLDGERRWRGSAAPPAGEPVQPQGEGKVITLAHTGKARTWQTS